MDFDQICFQLFGSSSTLTDEEQERSDARVSSAEKALLR